MKFNQFKNIVMLLFLSVCAWVLIRAMANIDSYYFLTRGKIIGGVLLLLPLVPFVFSICFMRLFVWRVGLERVGDNLAIVTTFQKHVVPLSEIMHYELKSWALGQVNRYSITLHTKDKHIKIYPEALVGGVYECRKYLKSHGIKEVNSSGGRKWAVRE